MNAHILDLIKTQFILNGSVAGLKPIVFLSFYETAIQTFPKWFPFMSACFSRRQKRNTFNVVTQKTVSSEILFEKQKEEKNNAKTLTCYQQRMDAIIHYVSKIPSICHLLAITQHDYLPHEFDIVKIDTDIYFQLIDMKHSDGSVELLKFKIFCYEHESLFLQTFVESCISNYERHMVNKLGTHKYFFNMMVQQKSRSGMQNPLPTNYIVFTKHKFVTSRTFDNVFFEDRDSVKEHTEFFLKNKEWYDAKGIPHTLGFMFHGEPGCGKTSTIKAIANVGKRHIINIHLSEIKSKEQLSHLFFNDEINVWDNGKTERYTIPVSERMYVIEDIDAMGETVLRREWKTPEVKKSKKTETDAFGNIVEEESNPIDLSFLLNLLDGTLESEGRILAITTNFPERIDRALIRPGRIDMILQFKKCSLKIIHQMVESFYDKSIDIGIFNESLNYKWSPAEVNQILFRNIKNLNKSIDELLNLSTTDLYGFNIISPES